jgi:hypothetical protein
MNDDERALRAVLDPDADQQVGVEARRAAEADLSAMSRGLALVAADARAVPPLRARLDRRWLFAAAAAAVIIAGLAAVPALTRGGRDDRAGRTTAQASNAPTPASSPTGAAIGVPAPKLTLEERVVQAERIVVGTVTKLERGQLGGPAEGETGDAYILATVRVDEAIKGPAGDAVAFSYDYTGTITTSEGAQRPWTVGDHVLLFLVSDAGTAPADVHPTDMQVAEGEGGRYFVDGDRLVDADFTLDDVRRTAG